MKKILSIALIVAIAGTACKKPKDGAPGATGKQGPQGNANVKTVLFSVNLNQFIGPLSNASYSLPYAVGSLNITEWDAVLLYEFTNSVAGIDYYTQLPFDDYFNSGTSFNHHYFEHGATGSGNIIDIYIRNSGGLQPYTTMSGLLYYKCVVIAGSPGIKAQLPDALIGADYTAVKAYYNIKD